MNGQIPHGFTLRREFEGHDDRITSVKWCDDGRHFISVSHDGRLKYWDAVEGKLVRVLEGHANWIQSVAAIPGSSRAITASTDTTLMVWDLKMGRRLHTFAGHDDSVFAVDVTPDGSYAISASKDQTLKIWDLNDDDVGEVFTLRASRSGGANAVAVTRDGRFILCGTYYGVIRAWDRAELGRSHEEMTKVTEYGQPILSLALLSNGHLASASSDGMIRIWDIPTWQVIRTLEGHVGPVAAVSSATNSSLFASKSLDGTVKIWDCETWSCVGTLPEPSAQEWPIGLAFHPREDMILTLATGDRGLRLWSLDGSELASVAGRYESYTSAKVVFVGRSNVGKSCLAMRLAKNRYPEDHELGSTHGMRFWPMKAEDLHGSAKPPDGQRRDVVLWDFGGQDEYQLVHQMFLHDTTLALILIDPTRGRDALDEARDWNRRLQKHLGSSKAVKLLVGAKQDQVSQLVDRAGIERLQEECGFADYIETSAKKPRNVELLRQVVADALDWEHLGKTSRPKLFQRIRDHIDRRRDRGEVVLLINDLEKAVRSDHDDGFYSPISSDNQSAWERENHLAAVQAVSEQLEAQGVIVKTKLMDGDEALVLQLPVIERYAGSLIVAARQNPRGVPVLEERLLGSAKGLPLPGMTDTDRLVREQEKVVLECIVELMIQHGICFRHGGLLVFPTLFPSGAEDAEAMPHSVSLYYDFTGAIDNIYAGLVSRLMVSGEFGEGRLKAGRVEFDRPGRGMCSIRQAKYKGGFAHLDLIFSDDAHSDRRDLFTRFVEEHLRQNGVDIHEHQAIKCRCGKVIDEVDVQANIAVGEKDVICPRCRTKTMIADGVDRIRKRDPESDARMIALRKTIDERLSQDVISAKKAVDTPTHATDSDEPIRILHLSDLHFTSDVSASTKLEWLLQDIRRKDGAYGQLESVEYLVISGDMTDKGNEEGFDVARKFVDALISELRLSTQRCIFVPGNHDAQDRTDAHEETISADGQKVMVRSRKNYPKRFQKFSEAFYHKLVQEEYPLGFPQQGIAYLFEDTGIQFLALNSAWQIDQFGRKRSDIHPEAVAHAIRLADEQRKQAIERGVRDDRRLLRIGVWHHAVAGPEMIQDVSFLSNLRKAGMRVCLHGDVHDMRCDLMGYKQAHGTVDVVGAGSFGSLAEGRPESVPRLYNLLEVSRDLASIRVHTRSQPQPNGAWRGWHNWPDPNNEDGRLPYFGISLEQT
jgi:small GTP-binding protein